MSKPRLIVAGSVAFLLLIFFAPALSGAYGFVFRDTASFYYPLFEMIRNEWSAGRVPLWNPYENTGMPLVAENTTSVFYPGKLLFTLPFDYTLLYNLYIVAHLALAAAGSYLLARYWQASVLAAGVAGLSYAFSGTVLFQYCNVVFLVGAAWLPLALLLATRMVRERSPRMAIGFGVVLALMVTGGDPQMAYNAALLAAGYAIVVWRAARSQPPHGTGQPDARWFTRLPVLLGIAATSCLLLAAVQILPTAETARLSGRGHYGAPRSLFELAAYVATQHDLEVHPGPGDDTAWHAGLLGTSPSGHQRHIYQFSVGPWRAIEFLWPNISGRQFPTNCRWIGALPAEGRVWVPSLYMGLLPFLLAIVTWSLRRQAALDVRLWSWMVVLGVMGSLGIYGVAWAAREIKTACGGSDVLGIGDEVGGLYWFLTVILPGYAYFRYPAKLFVIASLGLSLLAARGWDEAWQSRAVGLRRWLWGLVLISMVGMLALNVAWRPLSERVAAMPPDTRFGPFDVDGAWQDVMLALGQTGVLSGVLLLVFRQGRGVAARSWLPIALTAITLVDLAVAQRWLIPYAPAADWRFEPRVVGDLPSERFEYRVHREGEMMPASWQAVSSPERQTEALRWDRETLWPKYQLPYGISLAEASGSIVPYDYQVLWAVAREFGEPDESDEIGPAGRLPHGSVLDLLAVRFAILPGGTLPKGCEKLPPPAEDTLLCLRPRARPRAWIVHRVETLPQLGDASPAAVKQRTREVLFSEGKPRDWAKVAVVEADEPIVLPATPSAATEVETCRIRSADPQCVEIDVHLESEGLVVLSDLYYPGWECTVEAAGEKQNVPFFRCNRVMRGVVLPAGEHRLVYRYRSGSVAWGGAISAVAALGLAVGAAVVWRQSRAERKRRQGSRS